MKCCFVLLVRLLHCTTIIVYNHLIYHQPMGHDLVHTMIHNLFETNNVTGIACPIMYVLKVDYALKLLV